MDHRVPYPFVDTSRAVWDASGRDAVGFGDLEVERRFQLGRRGLSGQDLPRTVEAAGVSSRLPLAAAGSLIR